MGAIPDRSRVADGGHADISVHRSGTRWGRRTRTENWGGARPHRSLMTSDARRRFVLALQSLDGPAFVDFVAALWTARAYADDAPDLARSDVRQLLANLQQPSGVRLGYQCADALTSRLRGDRTARGSPRGRA